MSPEPGPTPKTVAPLTSIDYEELVRRELAMDLGAAGDITTDAIVPGHVQARAHIVARHEGRVCGLECAVLAFGLLGDVRHRVTHGDGVDVEAGTVLAEIEGPARALLSAERTALNLLGHLSGIATATRDLVRIVADAGHARVACTRKTTPGLRVLEKYAVRVGGASNHRIGLHDAVLIKDNHRAIAGGVGPAVAAVRAVRGRLAKLEVEVDTLEQLDDALEAGADTVLLDNMSVPDLERAVAMARGRATTEASGGITPATIHEVAATGVDVISVGWITHSAPSLDVGLDFSIS
jgi:nicotinate-nucleotide pyrophosphorylase (carboxylating)